MSLTVGSLFSGIGGIDLGLERAGMTVIWQSEIDEYACRVLAKHWPDTPNLGDITRIDWSTLERPDVICGGYPCQPFSSIGQRRGEHDPRHLWPWVRDAVRVLRPRFLLCENVAGHLTLGFDRVLADLANLGFDVEWSVVSACSLGAPHARARLFFVAHAEGERWDWRRVVDRSVASRGAGSDNGQSEGQGASAHWASVPAPRDLGVAHGLQRSVDRSRLRGLGNSVVPQVAEHIGRMIVAAA